MITIYLKSYNKIIHDADVKILDDLGYDDILWIDMLSPTVKEKRALEKYMDISLQTQQQIEEIESSSRYMETARTVVCNTNFLVATDDGFDVEAVSFVVCEGVLISERNTDFRTFGEAAKRLQISYRSYPTGYHILISILEARIDLDADMVEAVSRQIAQMSKHISIEGKVDKEILKQMSRMRENTMVLHENIFDRQRVISGILRSDRFPSDIFPLLTIMIKDVGSLISHADSSSDRLDYLQEASLGLINIELSNVTKIFTVAAVFFMPATLIASIYGMNFRIMPELDWKYGYLFALGLMALVSIATYLVFRIKKWL